MTERNPLPPQLSHLAQLTAPLDVLVDACIDLAWSEMGTAAVLKGDQDAELLYEPWPEMEAMLSALDTARPGWRDKRCG